jgi:ZIP family zinc transporter
MKAATISPFFFSMLPVVVAVVVAGIAVKLSIRERWRSYAQHLAAGVVFAAVAVELLPGLMRKHEILPTIVGFAAGVILLLGLRSLEAGSSSRSEKQISRSYIIAIVLDLVIDGWVLGIGFAAGESQGFLLAVALSLELLSLSLALTSEVRAAEWSAVKAIGLVTGVSIALPLGTLLSSLVLPILPAAAFTGVLAFGVAALIYLVAEELLVEAHEKPDTVVGAGSFFVGFLAILVLDLVTK